MNAKTKHFITNKELILSSMQSRVLRSNKSIQIKNTTLGLIPEKKNHKNGRNSFGYLSHNSSLDNSILKKKSRKKSKQGLDNQIKFKQAASLKNLANFNNDGLLSNFRPQNDSLKTESNLYSINDIISTIKKLPDHQITKSQLIKHFEDKLKLNASQTDINSNMPMKMQNYDNKIIQPCIYNASKIEEDLMKKIELLYKQKNKLKKEKKALIQKLREKQTQENDNLISNQKLCSSANINEKAIRQQQKLQIMILEQSKIINQHNNYNMNTIEDLRKILFTQAKGLETNLKKIR